MAAPSPDVTIAPLQESNASAGFYKKYLRADVPVERYLAAIGDEGRTSPDDDKDPLDNFISDIKEPAAGTEHRTAFKLSSLVTAVGVLAENEMLSPEGLSEDPGLTEAGAIFPPAGREQDRAMLVGLAYVLMNSLPRDRQGNERYYDSPPSDLLTLAVSCSYRDRVAQLFSALFLYTPFLQKYEETPGSLKAAQVEKLKNLGLLNGPLTLEKMSSISSEIGKLSQKVKTQSGDNDESIRRGISSAVFFNRLFPPGSRDREYLLARLMYPPEQMDNLAQGQVGEGEISAIRDNLSRPTSVPEDWEERLPAAAEVILGHRVQQQDSD